MEKLQVKIGGMQCSFCTDTIKKALDKTNGIEDINISLAHEEALIQYDPTQISPEKIIKILKDLGFTTRKPSIDSNLEEEKEQLKREKIRLYSCAVLTLISLFQMILMWLNIRYKEMPYIMLMLALITMFIPGLYIKKMAFASLRRRILNQHVLLECAAFAGLIGGLYGFFKQPWPSGDFFAVSVFVTSYHVLSGYVSNFVRTKTSNAIRKLIELQPLTARVIKTNGTEEEVPIENVKLGDLVRIRAGERVPIDGIIIEGQSSVDQSLITGESIPIQKKEGDEVIGGSINQMGTLTIKVTKILKETFLQQVISYVQEARALKPGIIILIDKVTKYFVRLVLFTAIFTFIFWTFYLSFLYNQISFDKALFSTLAVLVMGYPCALGMATPLAMIRGGGLAAEKGILLKSAAAFQAFKDIDTIVFDKTGTLTMGKLKVVEIKNIGNYDTNYLLKLATCLEIGSKHPLAQTIVRYSLEKEIKLAKVDDFEEFPGLGIKGLIDDNEILVGSYKFLQENGVIIKDLNQYSQKFESEGLTVVYIGKNKTLVGMILLRDELRENAKEVIEELQSLNIEPIMITGDNKIVARAISRDLGSIKFFAGVLPQEKVHLIRNLQSEGLKVAMVGDGINDAPALMQADVGIAMGSGTEIAIESADVILINPNVQNVLNAYHVAKSSYTKTVQNIILAFSFNAIGVSTAILGLIAPVWAMVAMIFSVSAILINSFSRKVFRFKKIKSY